jgi:hypothetical protein
MPTGSVKKETIGQTAPVSGWAPKDSYHRLMSELDASTGKLTGDQQAVYADLPVEEYSNQPSLAHKIIYDDTGGATYAHLTPVAGRMAHMRVYGV